MPAGDHHPALRADLPGLRPAPGWTPQTGALSGTVYALPTLIRIYTGDRITGTDLTTLHLGVARR